ncbi:MAG TPA: hypothetical protein VFH29_07010, partial [Anaerolineales bacterium]|nr:hypothetical protein [Anaerolineales bacterium]
MSRCFPDGRFDLSNAARYTQIVAGGPKVGIGSHSLTEAPPGAGGTITNVNPARLATRTPHPHRCDPAFTGAGLPS